MKLLIIGIIYVYKITLSPFLVLVFGEGCKYRPTCSSYLISAIERFGVKNGIRLGIKRFASCHPFNKNPIFDPVPSKS